MKMLNPALHRLRWALRLPRIMRAVWWLLIGGAVMALGMLLNEASWALRM